MVTVDLMCSAEACAIFKEPVTEGCCHVQRIAILMSSPLFKPIRRRFKQRKWLVVGYHLGVNWLVRRRYRRGNTALSCGATHRTFDPDESVAYIWGVFRDYLRYGSLRPESLNGLRVLEVGPGDNHGVALLFIAFGASQVVTIDRFDAVRDLQQEREIYKHLQSTLPIKARDRLAGVVDSLGNLDATSTTLTRYCGVEVSALEAANVGPGFDLIVSRAVLEHIHSLERDLETMVRLMSPSGLMLHDIDLRDHGLFTSGGMHALTFLTVPDRLYRAMSSDCGLPNRARLSDYQTAFAQLGLAVQVYATRLLGGAEELVPHPRLESLAEEDFAACLGELQRIWPELRPRFRASGARNLMITGIFVVGRQLPCWVPDDPQVTPRSLGGQS